ncbi:TPA: ead/Ea22-like family protein [Enterobacter asburiae]|nr:ead/Ea22-like family protein [Enterobacter asburiae]
MSNIDKRALREAAEKATALNLDTAQEARQEDDECIECPTCGGDGYMEVQRDYCNIDGVALGVLFYGIGEHHGLAEAFFRAANPATVLALLDELESVTRTLAVSHEAACSLVDENDELKRKLEAAEKRTVEMPAFDGYVPHVARELQAAFRIACDNAGINVADAAGKGEAS